MVSWGRYVCIMLCRVKHTVIEWYTSIRPVSLVNDMTPAGSQHSESIMHEYVLNTDNDQTQQWLEKVTSCLSTDHHQETNNSFKSWSTFFASLQQSIPKLPAKTSPLPLFRDTAHIPATWQGHHKNVTLSVNPDQIPVMTVDQPVYALAKKIQLKWQFWKCWGSCWKRAVGLMCYS